MCLDSRVNGELFHKTIFGSSFVLHKTWVLHSLSRKVSHPNSPLLHSKFSGSHRKTVAAKGPGYCHVFGPAMGVVRKAAALFWASFSCPSSVPL
ncbi:hypothetical protein O6P43_013650 [Quillaja saponaria]|uniref:Uncharacterized protein n=1 Tax=Quillaja saponaria TaxID=32244 RepID=A0AAD7PQU1_QUISA|nr:hypothetical protein O6P43_013650 [Quillaja saponaria]